jgi:hypothetical protein
MQPFAIQLQSREHYRAIAVTNFDFQVTDVSFFESAKSFLPGNFRKSAYRVLL